MNRSLFAEGRKYTFRDYFDFNHPTEEIAAALGYSLDTKILHFPDPGNIDKAETTQLKERFYEILPKIAMNSEMAKRDFMIAPILWAVIRHVEARINVEYPIAFDDKLSGSLDYLIRSRQRLIVIEAKKGDLDRGFNQLAAELIALDKTEGKDIPISLYGAISIGELWRFGILNRSESSIYRDLHTYRAPEDLERILEITIGILRN